MGDVMVSAEVARRMANAGYENGFIDGFEGAAAVVVGALKKSGNGDPALEMMASTLSLMADMEVARRKAERSPLAREMAEKVVAQ